MKNNKPNHIAVIMDGNGRWAKNHFLNRTKGHEEGAKVVREICEFSAKHQEISYLTLYAFSTENWKRPKVEVDFLMKLLGEYLDKEEENFIKNSIKFQAIGNRSLISKKLQKKILLLEAKSSECKNLTLSLAVNYGSRNEIVRSVKQTIEKNEDITIESITKNLDLSIDVDLLIRTGSENRVSNFLLWQAYYAELFFTKTLWPDFNINEFQTILQTFKSKKRRFGGIL